MHCTMAITRKLFTLLALETRGNKEIEDEWERLLKDECNIELPEGKKGDTFIERWKRAQISRPEALRLLENYSLFIQSLLLRCPEQRVRLGQISSIWRRYSELTSLLVQAKVSIRENEWRKEARVWARIIIHVYGPEEITPYIHVFVYHLGYYLEKYGGVEKFGNYSLESKHSCNKAILRDMTNRFKMGEAAAVRQQLQANVRLEQHRFTQMQAQGEEPKKKKQRSVKSWAERSLPVVPRMAPYVVSSTHI